MSDSTSREGTRSWIREAVKRRIVSRCQGGFVAGKRHADYLAGLGMPRDRIYRGCDVVDNDHFAQGAQEARKHSDHVQKQYSGLPARRYFLAVNRLVEVKNLDRLLTAYAFYREEARPNHRALAIVGDGPLRPKLEERAADLAISEDLYLPGFKSYEDLPYFYGLADAFILASTSETWGLVVNEAMAAGLPVLVSENCGCVDDLVEQGRNGYSFNPFDSTDLSSTMVRMPTEKSALRQMGHASESIIADWGLDTFAQNLKQAATTARRHSPPSLGWTDQLLLRSLSLR